MTLTEEQLKDLASQLSKPNGDDGLKVADMMHDSNFGMTKSTIKAMSITENDQILELGHGNGKHISAIINEAENVNYTGLEISELMQQQAAAQDLNNASFYIYDGNFIPFKDNIFSKVITVNTIYFWKNPVLLLNEIFRVLKDDGIFCIGFANKEFMQTLPFTKFGFNLYNDLIFTELVNQTPFKISSIKEYQEKVKSKANEMIERTYVVATLKK